MDRTTSLYKELIETGNITLKPDYIKNGSGFAPPSHPKEQGCYTEPIDWKEIIQACNNIHYVEYDFDYEPTEEKPKQSDDNTETDDEGNQPTLPNSYYNDDDDDDDDEYYNDNTYTY